MGNGVIKSLRVVHILQSCSGKTSVLPQMLYCL